jgi:choline kinase
MKALILAAGRGTRLAPLTDDRPKCMIALDGITLLERQLGTLREFGVTDVTVIGGYHGESIESTGVPTVINREYARSNMVYTLFCASHLMDGSSDMIIAYGDIVYEPRVLKALLDCDAPVCVVVDTEWRRYWQLRMDDPLADAETLKLDALGRVLELGKKPRGYGEIQGQYMGLIKVKKEYVTDLVEIFNNLNPNGLYDGVTRKDMYMTSFLQHLIDIGWRVQSVPVANGWLELDTMRDLELYARMQDEGTLDQLYRIGNGST